jgi:methionyl-tRNA formyltransferase
MNKKITFMGTGPFALTILKGLFENLEEGDLLSVYTKADKKTGRGMKVQEGCVALFAKEHALPLYQPTTLINEEIKDEFLAIRSDLVVVASYGMILPPYILFTPPFQCVNIHASILPEYRGAAPINRAIMDGKEKTGVTLMLMDTGLDEGDILMTRETPITDEDCAGDLFERLAEMGRDMLLEALPLLFEKKLTPIPQTDEKSTYAAKIKKEDQVLSFKKSTNKVLRHIRGLCPIPSAYCITKKDGKTLKIHEAKKAEGEFVGKPGEIIEVKPRVLVKTTDGAVELLCVQPEGKGRMSAADAVNGRKIALGDFLV